MSNLADVALGDYLLQDIAPKLLEKQLFGPAQIRLSQVVTAGLWVFQKGALLGRARASSLHSLASIVSEPGRGESVAEFMQRIARDRLARMDAKRVKTFFDFWHLTEYPNIDFDDVEVLKVLAEKKLPATALASKAPLWVAGGIGFGALFPDITESLWRCTYESSDPANWQRARQAGVHLPEHESQLPLESMEQQVLAEVRVFVERSRPELLRALAL